MAIGDFAVNESTLFIEDVAIQMGKIGKWLQAIGLIIVLWIVFEVVYLVILGRKKKEIVKLREDVKRLEGKIDKLGRKRK